MVKPKIIQWHNSRGFITVKIALAFILKQMCKVVTQLVHKHTQTKKKLALTLGCFYFVGFFFFLVLSKNLELSTPQVSEIFSKSPLAQALTPASWNSVTF